jgi:hypothetical protein
MKCPTCNSTVSDDAAVCPSCDTVLDPSLLDASPPEADGDDGDGGASTGEYARPERPSRPVARPPRPGAPKKRPAAPGGAKRPGKRPATRPAKAVAEPKRDWREEVSADDWNQMSNGPREQFVADKAMDPDDVMGDFKRFVFELSNADKLAFFGSVTMFLACFFPWKETVADGEVLGLMSLGIVVFGLSAVAMAAIALRARKTFATLNPIVPWVAQLGAIGFGELWCLVYMRLSWDSTITRSPVGNFEMWASKPSFGVILAFLSGIVAGLGTIFGLRELGARR